jgi:hypothetical protein
MAPLLFKEAAYTYPPFFLQPAFFHRRSMGLFNSGMPVQDNAVHGIFPAGLYEQNSPTFPLVDGIFPLGAADKDDRRLGARPMAF